MTEQQKLDALKQKLSVAVSLIKVFSSYDLPITKSPSGESFIASTGFETLKTSIIIAAVDEDLFTNEQLVEAQTLIDKLSPILNERIEAKEPYTASAPAGVTGKLKAKLEIKR